MKTYKNIKDFLEMIWFAEAVPILSQYPKEISISVWEGWLRHLESLEYNKQEYKLTNDYIVTYLHFILWKVEKEIEDEY